MKTDEALVTAFGIEPGDLVTIIGGGGKTSLMFALARDLVGRGLRVVTTTTTKMLKPAEPRSVGRWLAIRDDATVLQDLPGTLDRHPHLTVGKDCGDEKIGAVSVHLVDRIHRSRLVDCVLVEGDGCRHRHLKAPRPGEPVIPERTGLVIPVVGIDIVGKEFTPETVFRSEIVEKITPYRRGDTITVEMVYDVLFHPQGIVQRAPAGARIVPFVSFIDGIAELELARELAARVMRSRPFDIASLVLGNADPGRVLEVVSVRR